MTSWALLLALAVSVLVHSSTHPALHPAPLLPQHATASHGLFACPFASCSVLFCSVLCCSAIATPRHQSQCQSRGQQPTASALRDRHAYKRRMHQPTQDLPRSVSTHIASASAQQRMYHGSRARYDSGMTNLCYAFTPLRRPAKSAYLASVHMRSRDGSRSMKIVLGTFNN
jgi:hypothetical protein